MSQKETLDHDLAWARCKQKYSEQPGQLYREVLVLQELTDCAVRSAHPSSCPSTAGESPVNSGRAGYGLGAGSTSQSQPSLKVSLSCHQMLDSAISLFALATGKPVVKSKHKSTPAGSPGHSSLGLSWCPSGVVPRNAHHPKDPEIWVEIKEEMMNYQQ